MIPLLLLAPLAAAASSSPAHDLHLTVYNRNLGLVREIRSCEVVRGDSQLAIDNVAAQIDPTSVHLREEGTDTGLEVLEQNYQYDLASPDRILERALNEPITALSAAGEPLRGKLVAFTHDQIVLQREDEGLSLLRRDKVGDLRLEALPRGLITRPTLLWNVRARHSGRCEVELSYLTQGLDWHAEYVITTDAGDTQAELAAWVSVDNHCGTDFDNAQLHLIAGDLHRVATPQPVPKMMAEYAMRTANDAGFEEEALFDYHLYTLPHATSLRDRETKQLALFPATSIPVEKRYEYEPWRNAKQVEVVLEFRNSRESGLGIPLPGGTVRAYKRDRSGSQHFIGEDRIAHTPRKERVSLKLGNAFDIPVERTVLERERISSNTQEEQIRVQIRNRKEERVTVVVRDRLWGEWKILRSSHDHKRIDANTAEWAIQVAADGETELTYTTRQRR
jgi:hypothetical protein